MGTVSSLETSYIFTPLELAALSYLEALALGNHKEAKGNIVLLWQSTLFWREENPTGLTAASHLKTLNIHRAI